MKKALVLLVVLVVVGCTPPLGDFLEPNVEGHDLPTRPGDVPPLDPEIDTAEEVVVWVSEWVEYSTDRDVHDKPDEWQQPLETYRRRTGDCEDLSLLSAYLMDRLGIPVMIWIGFAEYSNDGHVWVESEGVFFESQLGSKNQDAPYQWPRNLQAMTLEEAMGIAMYRGVPLTD